ncbi:hypothetical protein AB0K74_38225 [Streptomyces sp. NPDC056159]|uniref:hypothetical protein n=1 Tax=Streptomyces sp. NPDC056159 TaxID=3155537 RepID=UPI003419F88B
MKLSEALKVYGSGAYLFGGKAAGRKGPKKVTPVYRAELQSRGMVKLFAEDGTELFRGHGRTLVFITGTPC